GAVPGSNSVFLVDPAGDGQQTGTAVSGDAIQFQSTTVNVQNAVTAQITGGAATASGTATSIQFTASLSAAVPGTPVTIHYSTLDGTAVAGTDYTGVTNGTVQIAAGATSATFNIGIPADSTFHSDRSFTVGIIGVDVSPSGLVTFDPTASQGTGT